MEWEVYTGPSPSEQAAPTGLKPSDDRGNVTNGTAAASADWAPAPQAQNSWTAPYLGPPAAEGASTAPAAAAAPTDSMDAFRAALAKIAASKEEVAARGSEIRWEEWEPAPEEDDNDSHQYDLNEEDILAEIYGYGNDTPTTPDAVSTTGPSPESAGPAAASVEDDDPVAAQERKDSLDVECPTCLENIMQKGERFGLLTGKERTCR